MRRAILGTAGHIDHGKTALVRALTGVDTDRLPEEKARGITIELGFAELALGDELRLGVVDVPGHEDFIRTMVAGATGMDVVLLTVAADEGIMPQTREHLDILRLLAVPRMVVALTKVDAVEADWLALVDDEVRSFLADTPWAEAPVLATSAREGTGLDALRDALAAAAREVRTRAGDDPPRLPVDRAFTIQGMGTVVTGTLWAGSLSVGDRVRLLPTGLEGRIRSLQVHGRDATRAEAGERTAVAVSGVDRAEAARGQTLVTHLTWESTWMLTSRISVLAGAPRGVEQGMRVRVLLGTAEVLARCAVLEPEGVILPGDDGWVQFRLEEPTLARAGDRLVVRSYSPLLTVGGGVVAEPTPPKRRRLAAGEAEALLALASGPPEERVAAALHLAGWAGVEARSLVQSAGASPTALDSLVDAAEGAGALHHKGRVFAAPVVDDAKTRVLGALDEGHAREGLRPSVPLERLRAAIPSWAAAALADGVVAALAREGALELAEGGARRPGFQPTPTPDQQAAGAALRSAYDEAGLAAPFLDELPESLRARADLPQLLRYLEGQGVLRTVDDGLLVSAHVLDAAAEAVTGALGGRTGLGPADFREVLPVSRRHLMPLLAYLDGLGVTVRRGPTRDVPPGA